MNIKLPSKAIILLGIALAFTCPVAFAQESGSSDRTAGSFDVPGWFPKSQSDIARYPVPLLQPQEKPADAAPLVVLQRFGPQGSPSTKSIFVPTPFGYQQKQTLGSMPFVQPGFGGFGGGSGYGLGGFGGYSSSYFGGIPSLAGAGFGGFGGGYGIPGIPGLGAIPGLGSIPGLGFGGFGGGLGSVGRMGGFGGFGGFGAPGFGIGHPSRTIIVQPSESKNQGNNYYTPPAASGNSGSGYYSSGTPAVQPAAVTVPARQSPKDYWGEGGNPFGGQDLNKTPW